MVKLLLPLVLYVFFTIPTFAQSELCNNGIDDDGDGLIDCCDPDIALEDCCLSYFSSIDTANCSYQPPSGPFEFALRETEIDEFFVPNANYSPLVADIDFDGHTEFLLWRYAGNSTTNIENWQATNELLVLDTEDWSVKYSYTFSFSPTRLLGSLAIGDVDCDRRGDIFVCEQNVLYRLEYDSNLNNGQGGIGLEESRFISFPNPVPSERPNLILADLNADDNPELILGNRVYDAQTLDLRVDGGNNSMGLNNLFFGQLRPDVVAMDVLAYDPIDCPDCEGLEIIAGNQVYGVDLDVPSMSVRRDFQQIVPSAGDGATAVADIDRNGTYDAVVIHKPFDDIGTYRVYAYEIESLTPLAANPDGYITVTSSGRFGAGRPTLINTDSDPELEVIFVTGDQLHVFEHDLSEKWTDVVDDFSGFLISTAFDFNGDGVAELLFRDEYELRIYDASGATPELLYTTACMTASAQEHPVIADFDDDGQAEISCSCILEEYVDLESASNPKGPARLRIYDNVGSPWPAAPPVWNQLGFNITNISSGLKIPSQPLDNVALANEAANGLFNSFGAQIGIYDPELQRYLAGDALVALDSVVCSGGGYKLSFSICNQGSYILSPEMPLSLYVEDPTTQSIAPLAVLLPLEDPLGAGACASISLEVGEVEGGMLWAIINDAGDSATPLTPATDLPNTSVAECDYGNNLDSILLPIPDSTFLSLEICEGDTASIIGDPLTETGVYAQTFQNAEGCDSVVSVNLTVLPASIYSIDTLICPGEGILVNGTTYNAAQPVGTEVLAAAAQNGCDSIINVSVNYVNEVESYVQVEQPPCSYDTTGQLNIDGTQTSNLTFSLDGVEYSTDMVFDQLLAGAYRLYIESEPGCTFVYDFEIEVPAPLLMPNGGGFNLNQGCTLPLEVALNTDDSLAYAWSPAEGLSCTDCPNPITRASQNTTYTVTVTDANGCQETQTLAVKVDGESAVYIPNAFSPNSDGVNDFFYPFASECVREIRYLRLFDRWGNFVFEAEQFPPNDPVRGWDGNFLGKPMKPGVFAWVMEVVYQNGGTEALSGDVQLAR